MCQASEKLIFCSCETPKENVKISGSYQWSLSRYLGSKKSRLKGSLMMPSKNLGGGLSLARVIDDMNSHNCFDFEYMPQERDCLHVDNGVPHPNFEYFNLIYREGKWQEGRNPPFGRTISENLGRGRVGTVSENM